MMRREFTPWLALIAIGLLVAGCGQSTASLNPKGSDHSDNSAEQAMKDPDRADSTGPSASPATTPEEGSKEIATFGAGCFWCVEAVLEQLDGVKKVTSGYMGGHVPNPTYEQVCSKTTGHAEVVQVEFDPGEITYEKLLDYFWKLHDPTTLNRQGNDEGPQYRSVVFYHSDKQKQAAERSRKEKDASGVFDDPIVTEITAASKFYPAEDYHQDYYRQNKTKNPYCPAVITPKLKKLGLEY